VVLGLLGLPVCLFVRGLGLEVAVVGVICRGWLRCCWRETCRWKRYGNRLGDCAQHGCVAVTYDDAEVGRCVWGLLSKSCPPISRVLGLR
jgi:hypothetical protein